MSSSTRTLNILDLKIDFIICGANMNGQSIHEHLTRNKWVRLAAGMLAFIMLLTAVFASMARVTLDLSDFDNDPDAAAGTYLLEKNDFASGL
jgi:hypothetical protein